MIDAASANMISILAVPRVIGKQGDVAQPTCGLAKGKPGAQWGSPSGTAANTPSG
ncbi:MAG TPA: hypothetical protein PLL20_03520 [Phycisphaerae bacterium]|nr:hypothetical protein [Phycisphaerae bacterium]HRR84293.1 hypothetical protein [Phycisphaerae bacterium]